MRWPDDYTDPASIRFPEDRWDPTFKAYIEEARKHPDRLAAITLIDPPDVATSRGELDTLLNYPHASDFNARRPEIINENSKPPESLFAPLQAQAGGPKVKTRKMLIEIKDWSLPYIMYFKSVWMRPRPDHLDSSISTVIPAPGHPAYPSGHSTQAHLMALVGYEICQDTTIRKALWAAADRIAQNREYAGVHYRSDSLCGAELAKQLLAFFIAERSADIEAIKGEEWP
ncbi:phosphatase PAP2 family protein [Caulobacter sp. BP25]|uniref:phosphatase PAP2 family protein n=1 Tax=Caulobacter sp. BP25 TaxID=2048900 RepID=UPI00137475F3|nr:phosphatase PAP2 family protein [Caulobacter sp. BP25]